jgi:hypothetical protein
VSLPVSDRQEEIRAKGFNIVQGSPDTYKYQHDISSLNYNKIKVGVKNLDDAILDLGVYQKVNPRLADKKTIIRAIDNYDLKTMREISDFFYKTSGIYARILRYMAFMYRYDWYVTPYVKDKKLKKEKLCDGFDKVLSSLDNFKVKKVLGEIALKVLRYGAYYGYKVESSEGIKLQELPCNYCRSRFFYDDLPAIEFNMKFFDDYFKNTEQKMKILKLFPKEFSKGYALYKKGKLLPEFPGDSAGWYLLDPKNTVKFNANNEDYPMFIAVIPLILDLDAAQDLDRKRSMQRLLKIVIQKMPLDKNGDLIFDVDEAQQVHNNAVQMLSRAVGVDVLTTFADVEVATLTDTNAASAQTDDLERVERQLYNEAGVSQKQFNTDSNIALEKSILNDEATMYNLLLQFEVFLNSYISNFNKQKNKVEYKVQLLTTTIYNYKELSKLYKEQTQLGYSKMLPQIALGQSQSSILANAYFENEVLDLVNLFIPPLMSSTMNENILNRVKDGNNEVGRKEKSNDEKSDKTIANIESGRVDSNN